MSVYATAGLGQALPSKTYTDIPTLAPPVKEGQVSIELSQLASAIYLLEQEIKDLSAAIAPVTIPYPTGKADNATPNPPSSIVATNIRTQRNLVLDLVDFTRSLRQSVDL